jgi:hypothetical protein
VEGTFPVLLYDEGPLLRHIVQSTVFTFPVFDEGGEGDKNAYIALLGKPSRDRREHVRVG